MAFDINVAFNVQTQELVNARNALQSLTQAARELNTNQDKAVKTAEKLVDVNDKLAESASSASKAAEKSEKATKSLAGEGDAAATKLARLKDQLSFLRDDLNLSEVGFTKSQAGVLAWAKSVGATNDIIKQFANTFDNLNKVTGSNPFDQSAKGLSSLTREFYEIVAVQDLAASGFGLTAKQVQMLSRDIESLQQQNRAFGRDANDGVDKLRTEFLDAANSVNSYRDQIKAAQQANESLFKQEQELARHRNSANNELMKTWADGVGKRSQAMEQLSAQYAQEAKAAASAEKVAADAIAYTDRETRRLIETNDLLSRGFTSSSANAIFKYKEALEKTGISANELKQKLYLLEQDLAKRQGTSPFAKMREDIKQVTQQTNHLARAISVQLGDVAISLAGGQNPFIVLMQQGDQIRGAVQQAVDAGQSIDKAMAGAFASMFNSVKMVGAVIKEFAMDGLRSVGDALNVVSSQMARNNSINKQFADGTITATRHARLLEQASLQNAKALGTLRLVALGTAAAFAVTLVAAYVSLSKEQDAVAKSNAQFGASFGASTQEALAMARGLREFGVNTETAIAAMSGLMKAGDIGKESFKSIAIAAADAQKYVGISVEDTVKKFNDLAKDPVKVLSEFTQQTGYLSQAQLQLVRDLVEAGNGAEAQRVAIKLLEEGYKSMTSQAQEDMSALGRATVTLKDSTSTLWDEFKNSSAVEIALNGVKIALGILNGAVQAVVVSAKVLWATLVAAGKGLKALYENALDPSNLGNVFAQIGAEWTGAIDKALQDGADSVNNFAKAADGATGGAEKLTAEQRRLRAEAEQVTLGLSKMAKANEENVKSLAKSVDIQTYAAKRLEEENKAITKDFTEAQKKAFFESEQYLVQKLASEKRFHKEWTDANKKSQKTASETYKAVRDNTIVETKKFYDTQLKALQDYESKQSQVNKSAYDSRAISLGEYLAKELQLVASSQNQQLSILKTSEAAYLSNVEARKQVLTASAKEAIAKGGNASKIMEKLAQDIENLENSTKSSTEAFKTQRQALENATNAKYAKFYEEIAKTINSSKDALEKFNETVSDNARKRSESLEEQRALLDLHGAEAAAYKASRSAMSGYSSEIRESKKALEEATKALSDFNETTAFDDASSFEQYKILVENKTQAEKRFIETTSQAQKDANQAAADAMLEYNLGVFKEIRDSLSESVYDALFEGGKNGGQAIKDTLKKMFKNYVINVFLNPIMGQVAGAVGMGPQQGALGSQSGIGNMGWALNMSNLASMGGWGLTTANNVGTAYANATNSGIDGLLASNGAYGTAANSTLSNIGTGLSYAGALYSATQGQWGSAVGTAVGTYFFGPIGAAIGGAIGGMVDGLFAGDSGTSHMGAGAIYSGGSVTGGRDIYNRATFGMGARGEWNSSSQDAISGIAGTLGKALDGVATSFGQKAGYSIYTAFADDSSKDGAWGSLKIADALGNTLVDWGQKRSSKWAPRIFGNGEEGYKQYLNAVAQDVKSAFVAMDLPGWADQVLNAATDIETLSAALTTIGQIKAGFDALGKSMQAFNGITAETQTILLEQFGSFEALSATADTFYQSFYAEDERIRAARMQMLETLQGLGVSIDPGFGEAAKEQFRALVETSLQSGQAEMAAKLLAMSGAFSQVADYAQQATDSLRSGLIGIESQFSNGGMSRQYRAEDAAKQIQSMLSGVGIGKDVGAVSQALMSATSSDVEAYFREIWGALNTDEAKQKLIQVTDVMLDLASATDAAAEAIAKERYELESRFLQTIGDTIALRKRELETLDPSNRALQERIWAIEDASKAVDDASKSMDTALNDLAKSIDAEKSRINSEYDAQIAAIKESVSSSQTAIKAAQTGVDVLKSILEEISDAVKTLRGQVDPIQQTINAREFIDKALADSKRGIIPDQKGLSDAIGVVTNDSTSGYATAEDYKRAQLIQANKLEELGKTLGVQYSVGEKQLEQMLLSNQLAEEQIANLENARRQQLEALDSQLQKAREQVDVLRGVDVGVKSVGSAMAALSNAMGYYQMSISASIKAVADAIYATNKESDTPITTINARAEGGYTPAGLTLVGERGPELVNFKSPSMVYTAPQTANLMGGNNAALTAKVQVLIDEITMLRAEARATAVNTGRTYRILDDATQGGNTIMVTQVP